MISSMPGGVVVEAASYSYRDSRLPLHCFNHAAYTLARTHLLVPRYGHNTAFRFRFYDPSGGKPTSFSRGMKRRLAPPAANPTGLGHCCKRFNIAFILQLCYTTGVVQLNIGGSAQ
jgi:hypothetical protein